MEREENKAKIMQKNYKTKDSELDRMQKKRLKQLDQLKKELEGKNTLLAELKKKSEELTKSKMKVIKEEEEKKLTEKEEEEKKLTQKKLTEKESKMVQNLKKFQTHTEKPKEVRIGKNNLYLSLIHI